MQFESVIFDFDSTMVSVETFELLAAEALKSNPKKEEILVEFQSLTNAGMNGDIPLEVGFAKRMALVSLTRAHIDTVIPHMRSFLSPSFERNKDFFDANKEKCFIVSGGFSELIYPVSDYLGIPRSHVFANEFLFDATGNVIGLNTERPTCRAGGKAAQILVLQLPKPAVMIGDGMTDYEAKKQGGVDTFFAYTEFSEREKVCIVADEIAASFEDILAHFGSREK